MIKKRITISIAHLNPDPDQPRKTGLDEEGLADLSESIKTVGVLQEILVTDLGNGKYQIVYGERRYRAALMAGLSEIEVTVVDGLTEDDRIELQLIENLHRRELSSIERANGVARLVKRHPDQQSVAKRLGISKGHLSQLLELTELTSDVQEISDKKITRDATTLALTNQLAKKSPETAAILIEKAKKDGKLPRKAVVEALRPYRKARVKKNDGVEPAQVQGELIADSSSLMQSPAIEHETPPREAPLASSGDSQVLIRAQARRKLHRACRVLGLPESMDIAELLERVVDAYLAENEVPAGA